MYFFQIQLYLLNPPFHPSRTKTDSPGGCRIDRILAHRNGREGVAQKSALVGKLGQAIVEHQQVSSQLFAWVRALLPDTSHRCLPFSCDQLVRPSEYPDTTSARVITQFMERMSA